MRGKGLKNVYYYLFTILKQITNFFERLQIRQFAAFLKLKILHNVDINAKQKEKIALNSQEVKLQQLMLMEVRRCEICWNLISMQSKIQEQQFIGKLYLRS